MVTHTDLEQSPSSSSDSNPDSEGTSKSLNSFLRPLIRWFPVLNESDIHTEELLQGTTVAAAYRIIATGLGFIFNLLLSRLLGASDAGIYLLALSIINIAIAIGQLGLNVVLVRFIAAHAARNEWDKVKGAAGTGIIVGLVASGAITVILLTLSGWMANSLFSKSDLTDPLRIMSLGIAPVVLSFLYGELLRGLKRIRDAMLIQEVGISILMLPILVITSKFLGVKGAALSFTISSSVLMVTGCLAWRQAIRQLHKIQGRFNPYTLLRASIPLFWVSLITILSASADGLIVGFFAASSDLGVYGVAKKLAILSNFILLSVDTISSPKFAALHAAGDYQKLRQVARRSTALIIFLSAPILIPFVVFPEFFLRFFGPEFASGASILRILMVGQLVNLGVGTVGHLLAMTGYETTVRNTVFFSALIQISVSFLMVSSFGVIGAAIAYTFSLAFTNIVMAIQVYRKLSIVIIPLPISRLPLRRILGKVPTNE